MAYAAEPGPRPSSPSAHRKQGARQYQVILPNTFGELVHVAQRLTGIPGKPRIFVDGGTEITSERQYEAVEPGDILLIVDARGKKIDLSDAIRRHSLEGQGTEQKARMEMPTVKNKLVKFTSMSDYQEHFVKHEGVAVNRPCVPKGRLVEPVPREEQLAFAKDLKYEPNHAWWKSGCLPYQSESASAYVTQEIELRDAQKNSRKNLVSDFKLFAHRSNEPDVKLETEKKSESQNYYTQFSRSELDQAQGIEPAGLVAEVVTSTRTVPVDAHEKWWANSPFEFTSESRSHFKDHQNPKRQGPSTIATGENKECWDPERRIGVEIGSVYGNSRRSSVNS
jgi:hypothetical protein